MAPEKIGAESNIYKGTVLTLYQSEMNQASLKLCLDDPTLITGRGKLVTLAREKVHLDRFQYTADPTKVFQKSRENIRDNAER